MKIPRHITRLFNFAALLLFVFSPALAQSQVQLLDQQNETSAQTRLKLKDGSSISVDDAWESEQGIWYRVGGISHLMTRDRVKGIERRSNVKATPSLEAAR